MAAKAEICFHYLPLRFELFSRRNDFSAYISYKICFSSQPWTWYFSSWLMYHFCWDSFNCNIIWWWSRNEFSWGIQSGHHMSTVTTTAIYTFGSGRASILPTAEQTYRSEKRSREGAKKCTSLRSWEVKIVFVDLNIFNKNVIYDYFNEKKCQKFDSDRLFFNLLLYFSEWETPRQFWPNVSS